MATVCNHTQERETQHPCCLAADGDTEVRATGSQVRAQGCRPKTTLGAKLVAVPFQKIKIENKTRAKKMKSASDAMVAKSESEWVDFKGEFDYKKHGSKQELVKDIVAFANSGGGYILVGVTDDGKANPNTDAFKDFKEKDISELENAIDSCTGGCSKDVRIEKTLQNRDGIEIVLLKIYPSPYPLLLTDNGGYQSGTKQKSAFNRGTMYIRSGSRSMPADNSYLKEKITELVKSNSKKVPSELAKFKMRVQQTGFSSSDTKYSFEIINTGGVINRAELLIRSEGLAKKDIQGWHALEMDINNLKTNSRHNFSISITPPLFATANTIRAIEFKIFGIAENGDEDSAYVELIRTSHNVFRAVQEIQNGD